MSDKQSIWKKEISLRPRQRPVRVSGPVEGDGGNREVPPVEAPEVVADAPAESVPFWKKEIRLGGGSKAPKAEQAPKAAKVPKAPKAQKPAKAERSSEEQPSIWKRELSFGKKKTAEPVVEPVADALE
ncbi:MAG: hypothetical protein M3540_11905, partial [Actinomycetota bacterium]|nr:hypothetical protein [Actinomycetota bacterium]